MLREKWTRFSITVNKYVLPLESNIFVRLKAISHFILQNLEAINRPVSEIENYNDCHMALLHEYTWIL